MASASGKGKDGPVTEEELKAVEYALVRSKRIEENERRIAVVFDKGAPSQKDIEENRPPKGKKIGMDVLLCAWTGPEMHVAKATIISTDRDTVVSGEPLGPATYEVIVNVAIKRDATLPYQYDDLRCVADAVTRSIAWPSSKMKPYKPRASSLSRR